MEGKNTHTHVQNEFNRMVTTDMNVYGPVIRHNKTDCNAMRCYFTFYQWHGNGE